MSGVVSAGDRFGRRVVVSEAEPDQYNNRRWRVRCDCGSIDVAFQGALRAGQSTECRKCSNRRLSQLRTETYRNPWLKRLWDSHGTLYEAGWEISETAIIRSQIAEYIGFYPDSRCHNDD